MGARRYRVMGRIRREWGMETRTEGADSNGGCTSLGDHSKFKGYSLDEQIHRARDTQKKNFFLSLSFLTPRVHVLAYFFLGGNFIRRFEGLGGGHVNNFDLAFCEFSNFFNRSLSSTIFFSFCINDSEKDEIVHT